MEFRDYPGLAPFWEQIHLRLAKKQDINPNESHMPQCGKWQPKLGFTSASADFTQHLSLGSYYKIGQICMLSFKLRASILGVVSDDLVINGLPFSANSDTALPSVLNLHSNYGKIISNESVLLVYPSTNFVTVKNCKIQGNSDFTPENLEVWGSGIYITD